jgi:hypothetical protein
MTPAALECSEVQHAHTDRKLVANVKRERATILFARPSGTEIAVLNVEPFQGLACSIHFALKKQLYSFVRRTS